jgi:NRE family putative nickel resistance protein-like MFS transporter
LLRGDSYQEVLANRNFLALWLGQALSHVAQSIIYVVVTLYVYELTGSAQQVSFAVALELLPLVVVAPLAGVLADRMERSRLLFAGFCLQAVLVGLLPFTVNLPQVYLLVFLSSLLAPVTGLVWAAALPAITGQRLFVRGSSLDIVAYNVANVGGPVLGGWLLVVVGAKPAFFAVAGCYLGAALVSTRGQAPAPRAARREPLGLGTIRSDLAEAMRFLRENRTLRFLMILDCMISLGWSAPSVAAVVYLTTTLGLGGSEYGLLRGTLAMSMAVGVYVLGRHSSRLPRQRLLIGGAVLAGLSYMTILAAPGFAPLLGLWLISGIGWAAFWLMEETLWAETTSDSLRGRVYSLADAVVGLAEVCTALLGGWLVSALGPIEALFFSGLTVSVGAIALAGVARWAGVPVWR